MKIQQLRSNLTDDTVELFLNVVGQVFLVAGLLGLNVLLLLVLHSLWLSRGPRDNLGGRGHHCGDLGLLLLLRAGLTIVEGDLLPSLDVPPGKHCQLGHVGVEVVDEDAVDVKVGVTAVVDEMRQISIESCVHGVDVLLAEIEVQIKEICSALGIVFLPSFHGHVAGGDLPDVLHHKGASLDVLHGIDSLATAVVSPEDDQLVFPPFLDDTVGAVLITGTPLVTLVQRGVNLGRTKCQHQILIIMP